MTVVDDRTTVHVDGPESAPRSPVTQVSRVSGWRLSARLARREVRRRPGRTALVGILVAIPIAAMTLGLGVVRTADATPQEQFEQSFGQADLSIYLGAVEVGAVTDRLPTGSRAAVTAALPTAITPVEGDGIPNVDFRVIPFGDPLVEGIVEVTDGRPPQRADEVLVQRDVAADLGVAIGDTVELARPSGSWTVVGFGRSTGILDSRLFAVSEFDMSRLRSEFIGSIMLVDLPADIQPDDLQSATLTDAERNAIAVAPAFASSIGWEQYANDSNRRADALAWGWVAGAIALAGVGVIIAAAFASSARRQLTTIGQLSANGASESLVRRTLALQGAWTGLLGATVGVTLGTLLTPLSRPLVERAVNHSVGAWELDVLPLLVILATGIAAATIAATVPARSAARIPVLSALAGRRPLAAVPRRLVPIGLVLFAAGVALLVLVTVASTNDLNGSNENLYAGAAIIGGLAVLAGMCCASPIVIDLIGRVGGRIGGTWRLAARSVARSRTRSAGVLTAIAVTGTAAIAITTAVGTLAFGDERNVPLVPRDTAVFSSIEFDYGPPVDSTTDSVVTTLTPAPIPDRVIERFRAIVPEAARTERMVAISSSGIDTRTSRAGYFLLADDTTLGMLGLSDRDRAALERTGFLDTSNWSDDPNSPASYSDIVDTPSGPVDIEVAFALDPLRSRAGQWGPVVTPERAAELGLELTSVGEVAVSAGDLTDAQRSALAELQQAMWTGPVDAFVEPGDPAPVDIDDGTGAYVDTQVSFESTSITFPRALVDAIAIGVVLLLTLLVVAIGLSLAATESRDERDVLVAVGAKPRTLRGLAGTKAVVLTVGAAVLAIPTGFIPVAAVITAADDTTGITFPWLTAAGLVVVVPALAGLAALAASAIAQRVRPMTMSTLATD